MKDYGYYYISATMTYCSYHKPCKFTQFRQPRKIIQSTTDAALLNTSHRPLSQSPISKCSAKSLSKNRNPSHKTS